MEDHREEIDAIEIEPSGPIVGEIRPPGSKSLTNRALVCAALATGQSRLCGALESEDTEVMVESLGRLGFELTWDRTAQVIEVAGQGGKIPAPAADLFLANSGTSIRFLTALVSLGRGGFRLDGVARMRERPIGDLLDALRQLGVHAETEIRRDCPPVRIQTEGLAGGTARIAASVSSQFLSGLLMAAPAAAGRIGLELEGPLVSGPYVEMTLAVMRSFGVEVERPRETAFEVAPQSYHGQDYRIEPDASAASYFWAAAAITGGRVLVQGLRRDALQGDVAFVDALAAMGCEVQDREQGLEVVGRPLRGVTIDMNAISDTAQTLAVVALFADGPTTIRGVAHNRFKETDRIGHLAVELRKLGAAVRELEDGLEITPGSVRAATLDTYQDHRMAMSLALAGLRTPGVVIRDPGCTRKTYPRYFDDLRGLTSSRAS